MFAPAIVKAQSGMKLDLATVWPDGNYHTKNAKKFAEEVGKATNGGVVITDWYVNPEKPDERFKCTVYILDSRLRADGLNVAVFKQVKDATGNWTDAPSAGQTETDLENAILTKARQLRLSNIG